MDSESASGDLDAAGARGADLGLGYWYNPIPGFFTGNRFNRNIVFNSSRETALFMVHGWTDQTIAESDQNLFFHIGAKYYIASSVVRGQQAESKKLSFEDW